MAIALRNIEKAIANMLGEIEGLSAYSEPQESPTCPAVYPLCMGVDYDVTHGRATGLTWLTFEVTVLVEHHPDIPEQAFLEMEEFRDPVGERSIRQAFLNNRTLGGACDNAVVSGCGQIGEAEQGGTTYLGCVFEVDVYGR